mmetsp:Transcript_24918/g.24385  ORF Transcript_24918/g.24385 Transcript_24918/m.24385 type:complete len:137 (-) Transcript_24918:34-444(-)
MGIMLVYDCTSEESFQNVRNWVRQIELHANANVVRLLVANKCDLLEQKVINKEQGEKLATDFGMQFLEVSAKTGENVSDAFYNIAEDLKNKLVAEQEKKQGGGNAQDPDMRVSVLSAKDHNSKARLTEKNNKKCCS